MFPSQGSISNSEDCAELDTDWVNLQLLLLVRGHACNGMMVKSTQIAILFHIIPFY